MSQTAHDQDVRARAGAIERSLRSLRWMARRRLVIQGLGFLSAAFCVWMVLAAGMDYLVRWPDAVRWVLWAVGLGGVGLGAWWWLGPAWTFRPSLTQMALRVEGSPEGRREGLAGVLASGLELAREAEGDSTRSALSRESVERAATGLERVRLAGVVERRRTNRALGVLWLAGLPVVTLALLWPAHARIGMERVLTPWAEASWPRRTSVVDTTGVVAHPLGSALAMKALVTRTPHPPGRTDVTLRYRIVGEGLDASWRRAPMTSQGQRGESGGEARGELFERLVEPAALLAGAGGEGGVALEYEFTTEDDRTRVGRVLLVSPPAVVSARARVELPAYAAGAAGGVFVSGERELGSGNDQRATLGPVLAGSRVELTLELNKAIAGIDASGGEPARERALSMLAGLDPASVEEASLEGSLWRLGMIARESWRAQFQLRDEHGIAGLDDAGVRVEVVEDKPPSVVVVEPSADESVLATARVGVAGEARDDVGVASVEVRRQTARRAEGSVGASAEGEGEPEVVATAPPAPGGVARAEVEISLAELSLRAGDEVWLTAAARDGFELLGATHDEVVSSVRRLRIISESEMVEQFRSELSGIREAAIRLEQEQQRLAGERAAAVREGEQAQAQRARQRAIGERMGPLDDVVRRLRARMERNGFEDRELEGMLGDAGELLDEAAVGAREAEGSLGALADAGAPDGARREAGEALARQQRGVQDSLTQLANMLDRGQDTWAVRRALERLLNDQQQVSAQTRAVAQETAGRSAEELGNAQRADLDRVSARQRELAQRAASAMEAMESRARQMGESDPGQSQAMQRAANTARQQQLEQRQREAAEQIQQNQTGGAQGLQQEAERAIEEMLRELDKVDRQRDEALRRMLAEVMDSIQRLVTQQEGELARLGASAESGEFEGLDASMIALGKDTLAVIDRVGTQVRGGARLVELLEAASAAQASAITGLRLRPIDAAAADAGERLSLQRLKEALDEARRLEDEARQRDADRKRDELLKAYRAAAEEHAAIKGETEPLVGRELTRRERVGVRALARREGDVRLQLEGLRGEMAEIGESSVFDFAHTRLERALAHLEVELGQGRADAGVVREQASVLAMLKSLIAAVEDSAKKKDDFREDAQAGGGGGGGGGGEQALLPPVTQLKLLRGLQEEAADLTRQGGESVDPASRLQEELVRLANELIEQMSQDEGEAAPAGGGM